MFLKSKHEYVLLAIVFIAIIAYLPILNNDFTNWDDSLQVVNNKDIVSLSFSTIKTIFSSLYVAMYQSLATLSFAIEYHFFGLDAKYYHLTSLVIHLINIVLVYRLSTLITKRKDMALIVTSFFAVHPMYVEAIAWISARSTLLYSVFYIGALISYVNYIEKKKTKFLIVTFLLFLFSLLSKAQKG
jgi:hypothetical protein